MSYKLQDDKGTHNIVMSLLVNYIQHKHFTPILFKCSVNRNNTFSWFYQTLKCVFRNSVFKTHVFKTIYFLKTHFLRQLIQMDP